jgi:hypothetical protein
MPSLLLPSSPLCASLFDVCDLEISASNGKVLICLIDPRAEDGIL